MFSGVLDRRSCVVFRGIAVSAVERSGNPMTSQLGDAREAVIDNLSAAFAESAAWSIGFSALFLVSSQDPTRAGCGVRGQGTHS